MIDFESSPQAAEIRSRLADIAGLLTDDVHLTLVMRHPEDEKCWFIVSDDADYVAVADLITKQAEASSYNVS